MALSEVPRFFKFNDWEQLDPQQRAQRVLNTSRVPEIAKYILDNEEGYIFSSITASYTCPVAFTPLDADGNLGSLEMELEDMEFIINDGQHRAAAIAAALKENPALGKERISILLFPTQDLDQMQQMFTDLNRYVQKTSKSLDILYDHRDYLSALTIEVAEAVPVFLGMIDKERISLPVRSLKLLTLSALYDANGELVGTNVEKPKTKEFEQKLATATDYWVELAKVMPDWQQVKDGRLPAPALRQEKINSHTVVLRALGGVGAALLEYHPADWKERLQGLLTIDWRKSVGTRVNPMWDNVCIVASSVVSNRQARKATQAVIKRHLGLYLSPQESQLVDQLQQHAAPTNGRAAASVTGAELAAGMTAKLAVNSEESRS